jgi:hypothetical protein
VPALLAVAVALDPCIVWAAFTAAARPPAVAAVLLLSALVGLLPDPVEAISCTLPDAVAAC